MPNCECFVYCEGEFYFEHTLTSSLKLFSLVQGNFIFSDVLSGVW